MVPHELEVAFVRHRPVDDGEGREDRLEEGAGLAGRVGRRVPVDPDTIGQQFQHGSDLSESHRFGEITYLGTVLGAVVGGESDHPPGESR